MDATGFSLFIGSKEVILPTIWKAARAYSQNLEDGGSIR
jgi:hypothetical protein